MGVKLPVMHWNAGRMALDKPNRENLRLQCLDCQICFLHFHHKKVGNKRGKTRSESISCMFDKKK